MPFDQCADCVESRGYSLLAKGGSSYVLCGPLAGEQGTPDRDRGEARVRDVMTGDVVCVRASLTLGEVVDLVVHEDISSAPMVDDDGAPVGMISTRPAPVRGQTRPDVVIAPLPFVVHESATVGEAAALLVQEGIDRAPVVSAAGRLVGMLSAMDLARWLAAWRP